MSAPDPVGAAPDERPWLRRFVAARFDRKTYLGLHLTIGFVVACAGLWLFSALLDAVLDNATMVRWDAAVDAAVHARVTPLGLRIFTIITDLGSPVAMTTLAILGCALLWRQKRWTALITWLAAFVGGVLFNNVVKLTVRRDRPTYGTAYLHGHTYSFPSGHAMGSLIGYGMLLYLLGLYWHPRRSLRRLVFALVALLVLAIGVSRIYLGVHYPSDVIGGFGAGAAWLAICLTGLSIAQGRMAAKHPDAAAVLEKGLGQDPGRTSD